MRIFIALALLAVAMAGCGHEEDTNYLVEYQIGMSFMEIEQPISPDQAIVVRLTGVIGQDGRYSFDHAVVNETVSTYELTLFGLRNDDPTKAFAQWVVEWNGREFLKQPPHADSVEVVFHQPDGSTLRDTVLVRQ